MSCVSVFNDSGCPHTLEQQVLSPLLCFSYSPLLQSGFHGLGEVPVQGDHRSFCESRLLQWDERLDRYGSYRLYRLYRRRTRFSSDITDLHRPHSLSHDHGCWFCHRGTPTLLRGETKPNTVVGSSHRSKGRRFWRSLQRDARERERFW